MEAVDGLSAHALASGDPPSLKLCPSLLASSFLVSMELDYQHLWLQVLLGRGWVRRPSMTLDHAVPELEGLTDSM